MTVAGLLVPDGAEAAERHRAGARVGEAPVGALDREPAVAAGVLDLARVHAVVFVVSPLTISVGVVNLAAVGHDRLGVGVAIIVPAEDNHGGVVAPNETRRPQVQVLDPRVVALRVGLARPAGHAARFSAHEDAPAGHRDAGKMCAAAHIDRRAEGPGRIGDDLAGHGRHLDAAA